MDRKDLDRPEYGSYEEVHEMLVRAMQDACMNDTSREYESPQIDMSFLYEDEKPKKTMTYKIIRSAAILFLAFGMLLAINAVLLTSDCNDVYGEKGLLHRIHEGVRGIFTDEDPSQYVEVNDNGEVFIITDMKDIDKAKAFWPELVFPKYIPDNYIFKTLEIKKDVLGIIIAEYKFKYSKTELNIIISYNDYGIEKYSSANAGRVIENENSVINIYYDNVYDHNVADVYLENLSVHIIGRIEENDIIKIIEGIN